MPGRIEVGTPSERARFIEVARLMKAEADGKVLRAELRGEIKMILEPAVNEVRQGILAAASGGTPHRGEPLRQAIADGVKVGTSSGRRATGARVYVSKKRMPRNFANAPRDFNKDQFEHPAGRSGVTVTQVGAPGFFDTPLFASREKYRAAITAVVERMAARIAARH